VEVTLSETYNYYAKPVIGRRVKVFNIMSESKHSNSSIGWIVGFFIVLALLAVTVTTNYQKSDKIKYLNSQLSAAQTNSQSSSNSSTTTQTPAVTTPSPTVATSQSWLCTDSVDMNLGGDINALCTPSDGSTNDLSCSGSINTDLVTQYYPYANLNMTCTAR